MGGSYDDGGGDADGGPPEMQKAADAADISVLFFQLVLILVLVFCGKICLCAI